MFGTRAQVRRRLRRELDVASEQSSELPSLAQTATLLEMEMELYGPGGICTDTFERNSNRSARDSRESSRASERSSDFGEFGGSVPPPRFKRSEVVQTALASIQTLPSLQAVVKLRKDHVRRAQERLNAREEHLWKVYSRRRDYKISRRQGSDTADLIRLWPPRTPVQKAAVQRWERARVMLSIVQENLEFVESQLEESLRTLGDEVAAAFAELLDLVVDSSDLKAAELSAAEKDIPESLKVEDEAFPSEDNPVNDTDDVAPEPPVGELERKRTALKGLVEQCEAAKDRRNAARACLQDFFSKGRRVDPISGESKDDLNYRALAKMRELTKEAQDAESIYSRLAEQAAREDARSAVTMSGHFPMYDAYPYYRQEEAEAEGRMTVPHTDFDAIADWLEMVKHQATDANPEKLPIQWHQHEHLSSSVASTILLNEEINHKDHSHRRRRMIRAWAERGLRSYDDLIAHWPDEEIKERPQRASPDPQRHLAIESLEPSTEDRGVQTDATPPGTPSNSDSESDSYFTPPETTSSTDASTDSSPHGSTRSGANVWSDIQRASAEGSEDMAGRDSFCCKLL
jgi:hypothetical protein